MKPGNQPGEIPCQVPIPAEEFFLLGDKKTVKTGLFSPEEAVFI